MKTECDTLQALMSGYLDEELDEADRRHLELHLESCAECRREFDGLRGLVEAADSLHVETLPEDVWDEFLENVYNRTERRLGWALLILGIAALSSLVVYFLVVVPWASPLVKGVVALPVAGLLILFVSVLRQRLHVLKTDRYSRDVRR